jgi:hypothetical protein
MARFLSPIRESGLLVEALRSKEKPVTWAHYDEQTRVARYVVSDGTTVMCIALTDITLYQADQVEVACEDIAEWGTQSFRRAVEQALGAPMRDLQ